MNVKIRLLRGLLEEAIKNIDAGNSNHTEEELNAIIDDLTKLNRGIKRISKTYACEKILHCSPSTFDTYVKLGIIPPGHKEVGFKNLVGVLKILMKLPWIRYGNIAAEKAYDVLIGIEDEDAGSGKVWNYFKDIW